MDELEALRQQKLQQAQGQQELQQQVAELESVVKQAMTKDAISRYGNVRSAHPDKALQVVVALAQALQQGQTVVTDDMLKDVLVRLQEPKKQFTIRRK